ncbi:MAG: PaaI family thioesterase [Candidatus Marinimicrobia bacterium]|nr:PaaI family thioesterase [Candidatus Neomarinimicrobiota bacterium]MCF7828502.1 PaaI family thioesterase [Candidatus Neomarinimicrobiota bacterium]MCF7881992.1 PaaI family thioesterase [Candidatus Neomarinimicrobiota bacterium]
MTDLKKLIHDLGDQPHTSEQWHDWYNQFRSKTALEPHDVTLEEISADRIVLRMEIGDHALQPYGLLHGGMSMMLAESAASIHACWDVDLRKRVPVGIEINGSHLRPATEGAVRVVGEVIRKSRTLVHHHVEIIHEETGKVLSTVRMTNLYKKM